MVKALKPTTQKTLRTQNRPNNIEKLYGESTDTYDTTDADSTETAGGEENAE